MKKTKILLVALLLISIFSGFLVEARTVEHTVIKGESMWIIAQKYMVGLSEIIGANPQVKNPDLIYPNQILYIPLNDPGTRSFEQQVIDLTNQKRLANGLPALQEDWQLSRCARYKSQDMHDKRYFSHTSPTYGSPFEMMNKFNIYYRSAGENIAMGQKTPQQVVDAWWNSPGHRQNMLNASFTYIGVGYVADGNYWTQMFIGK
ncbi:MAG: hypothetical protein A2Y17_01895 [Clostridiales bacterium GWF2_38_85]|nr:MAG: hypothetical protein A2Y17_01895 [Clostridiales bacterium GWF2_38_85]HBL84737.1 hypothetical protein [Clostridiales bacterium]